MRPSSHLICSNPHMHFACDLDAMNSSGGANHARSVVLFSQLVIFDLERLTAALSVQGQLDQCNRDKDGHLSEVAKSEIYKNTLSGNSIKLRLRSRTLATTD